MGRMGEDEGEFAEQGGAADRSSASGTEGGGGAEAEGKALPPPASEGPADDAPQVHLENHAHERELGVVFDESISMRAEMDYQATTMILENKRMKDQLAVYAVVEEQNKVLKEEISKVYDELKSSDLRHKEEMENLKVPLRILPLSAACLHNEEGEPGGAQDQTPERISTTMLHQMMRERIKTWEGEIDVVGLGFVHPVNLIAVPTSATISGSKKKGSSICRFL
eukprot:762760-Hanusia_phi.AAC.13